MDPAEGQPAFQGGTLRRLGLTACFSALALVSFAAGCGAPDPADAVEEEDTNDVGSQEAALGDSGSVKSGKIGWKRVPDAASLTSTPPAAGKYRLEMIDLGSGLGILVRGHDFTMLYD